MTFRAIRATTALVLILTLLLSLAAAPALGQDKKKNKKKKEEAAPALLIGTVNGLRYRMADTKMADRVTRIVDAAGDQHTNEGVPAPDAPEHTDVVTVHVASTKMPSKLLRKMAKDYPQGAAGSFYGPAAGWVSSDPAIFVAAQLGKKRPGDALGQQLQVGIDGADGAPMEVGAMSDDVAGLAEFTLGGIFNDGSWSSGNTDVRDHVPGDSFDWYDRESGAFGFYDNRKATWFALIPRPRDAQRITVAVRSSTEAGEVVDRLELPGGGHFIDLKGATGGLDAKAGLEPLSCRALETYSGTSSDPAPLDPEATLIRYTAGVRPDHDPAAAEQLMAAATAAAGTIPMLLTAVGSDADPIEVDGVLEPSRDINAVNLTMEVPEGQWTFEPAEGAQVELPNGERLIDHRTLTGRTGVLTGPGLDGIVAGDPSCGLDDLEFLDDAELLDDPELSDGEDGDGDAEAAETAEEE